MDYGVAGSRRPTNIVDKVPAMDWHPVQEGQHNGTITGHY